MKKTALCKRFIGAASAVMLLMSFVPVISPGGYAFAEGAETFDLSELADNGIPVLNINIDEGAEGYGTIEEMNSSPDHSVECTGTVKLDVPDGYTGDYSDTALSDTSELKLSYIRGRGHSTWGSDKKPYKFKLDKSTDLLGMGKNKHWVLLAKFFDDEQATKADTATSYTVKDSDLEIDVAIDENTAETAPDRSQGIKWIDEKPDFWSMSRRKLRGRIWECRG